MEFGVNIKFVLGLPRAKQLGLDYGTVITTVNTLPPPVGYDHDHRFNVFFLLYDFPYRLTFLTTQESSIFGRPGRRHGLLYKHLHH